jgi:hypothetical protein
MLGMTPTSVLVELIPPQEELGFVLLWVMTSWGPKFTIFFKVKSSQLWTMEVNNSELGDFESNETLQSFINKHAIDLEKRTKD